MSQSLRNLRIAVRQFANRPTEEVIEPDDLRDVLNELENELEFLYLSPAERAEDLAMRPELEALARNLALEISRRSLR